MPSEVVTLLKKLVNVPSTSGQESEIGLELQDWSRKQHLDTVFDDTGVKITIHGKKSGKTLLYVSHLDTVPPGQGWEVSPYDGIIISDRLIGRGAVDAKASVASMCLAANYLNEHRLIMSGSLIILAVFCEETKDAKMPEALEHLGFLPNAAIIGEPTQLQACIGQVGLLVLRLIWKGDEHHPGNLPKAKNVIYQAAHDLVKFYEFAFKNPHLKIFTPISIDTICQVGMTPVKCEAVIDIRTDFGCNYAKLLKNIGKYLDFAKVEVISDRLSPIKTPKNSTLLRTIKNIDPSITEYFSTTCSDWAYLPGVDAVKLGPGDSNLSHTPNESVRIKEVKKAVDLYIRIAENYLEST